MKTRKSLFIAILALFMAVSLTACSKSADDSEESDVQNASALKAKQTIATPMLGAAGTLPSPSAGATPADTNAPTETPEGNAPETVGANAPAVLPPQDAGKAETGTPPSVLPQTGTAPSSAESAAVAPLGGTKADEGPKTEVMALPAPSVEPDAASQTKDSQPVAFEPKVLPRVASIDLVVDASGSMSAPFGSTSETKFDIVRKAVADAVSDMSQQQADYPRNFAVRVFGSNFPASENKCDDTDLVVPMSEPSLGVVQKALAEIKPQGTSPIAAVIEKSVEDFSAGTSSDRVVVLVVDGADNCGADVCASAKKVDALPNKPIIQIVGFDVSAEDATQLECAAKATGGRFYLARNENELRSSLGDAINASVPYNLKLVAQAGATPIPCDLTILAAGTSKVVRQEKSFGTKFMNLKPGNYDVMIEYADSPEPKKPSKVLKGVEILQTTRVEQAVNFDLGELKLSAVNSDGSVAPANYQLTAISADGQPGQVFEIASGDGSKSVFLSPGTYDVKADLLATSPDSFSIFEKGVAITAGGSAEKVFQFQKGSVKAVGITTQSAEIPFILQAYKQGYEDAPVASNAFPAGGGTLELAPGVYDLIAIGTDSKMVASPRTKVKGVEIKSKETTDVTVKFEMGSLKLTALDGQGNKLLAEFVIRDHSDNSLVARQSTEGPSQLAIAIPPGSYDIVATSLKSTLEPRPSVPMQTLQITADKPVEETVKFILGTLRLRGRNAKEQPIRSQFTIYKAGTDELVSSAPATNDWVVFDLAPGVYDALSTNDTVGSDANGKHMIWVRDLNVQDGKTSSHEAIYTAGKIKIIGRGANNKLIKSSFKVFPYRSDRELISGSTGDDWEIFEIEPGKYYLEASYFDEELAVVLKKWINITIGDNEVVEQVLRF